MNTWPFYCSKKITYAVLTFLLTFFILPLQGQELYGTVTNEKNQPLEFVNIVALASDTAFVEGTTSDSCGNFTLVLPKTKEAVWVRFSYIGYQEKFLPFAGGKMDTVVLFPSAQLLAEATVTAARPTYQMTPEGIKTKITGTMLADAGTLNDLLSRLPNLDGGKGSYTVFGRGQAVIYLNGQPLYNLALLDDLSSKDVESVEVINQPGAKYGNSVRAVIHIRTKKKVGDGLSGSAMAQYTKKHASLYFGSLFLNYRWKGLDAYVSGRYLDNRSWQEQQTLTTIFDRSMQNESFTGLSHNQARSGSAGINYEISKNQYVGVTYMVENTIFNWDTDNSMRTDAANSPESVLLYDMDTESPAETAHQAQGYYSGTFDKWETNLNFAYTYMPSTSIQTTVERSPQGTVYQELDTYNKTVSRLYAAKLVVGRKLKRGIVNFGSEYTYTKRNDVFDNLQGMLPSTDSEIRESNASLFAEYSTQWQHWMLSMGLRYQATLSDYYEQDLLVEAQSKDYHSWLPTCVVSTQYGSLGIQVSYAARRLQPSYYELRSDVQYDNRFFYKKGNPLLRAGISHQMNLTASYAWLQFYMGYEFNKDGTVNITEPYTPEAIVFMPVNLKRYGQLLSQLSLSPQLKFWNPTYRIAVVKQFIDHEALGISKELDTPMLMVSLQNYFYLPWELILGVNYHYNSKHSEKTSEVKPVSYLIASLSRDFLKDDLRIKLEGSILRARSRSNFYSQYAMYYEDNYSDTQYVTLSVRYTFNTAKSRYRGQGAGEEERQRL